MEYARYIESTVQMAVELVNSLTPGQSGGAPFSPPVDADARRRAALGALPAFGDHHVVSDLDDAQVEELFRLAGILRRAFEASNEDARAKVVNDLLNLYRAAPELIAEPDGRWRLHFHSAIAGAPAARGAGCATALAFLIESEQSARLGVCEAHACDRVFFDASRNGRKRFCSVACTNRYKQAQFRDRQAKGQSGA